MKKHLLFVMPGLAAGGGEKSLVNLLSQINYDLYDVDLFLLNHDGLFMEFVPKQVRVLPLSESYHLFTLPLLQSVKRFLLKGNLILAYNRFMYAIKNRTKKHTSIKEQYSWKHIEKSLDRLEKKYDAAVGFLEKTATYFCVDKVKAEKRIGWVHIDYDKLGMDPVFDSKYFKKLDTIVTVSEECANVLQNRFPAQKDKVDVIYNIVSSQTINRMAQINDENIYDKKEDEFVILSIGRLHYQKGFELAVAACKKLVDRGYNIQWNVIGEGEEREKLTCLIKENKLEKRFKLLGLQTNPYPYIQQADIYAQTSKFEGKSIAIDEAKILNKPIIVTNFSTAKDQIKNGEDGLIVEMDAEAVAEGIEELILNKELREKLVYNLSQLRLGTEKEIEKLYRILE
ncbi:glycosyltransferase [Domibacillus sp.]|uniref:glycosyltransferase n=1 Tax=Domibacillus sp. TaxID=1969783 RepID=UPI00281196D4|nr:glycosyltransferase [Domibacillus sp.]